MLATQRWAAGFLLFLWLTGTSLLVLLGTASAANTTGMGPERGPSWAILHPAFDPARLALWGDCWKTDLSTADYRQRRNALGMVENFHAANDWEQLGEVADWIRAAHETSQWTTSVCTGSIVLGSAGKKQGGIPHDEPEADLVRHHSIAGRRNSSRPRQRVSNPASITNCDPVT